MMTATANDASAQQAAFLAALLDPSVGCMKLRVLDAEEQRGGAIVKGGRFKATYAGWSDSPTLIRRWAEKVHGVSVFVTVNPVKRDLLARSKKLERQKHTTADADVACLRWAFIDPDPKRPADISATEGERQAAIECRDRILADHPELREAAIWGCSGNGGFILVRLADLPNDEQHKEKVKRLLAAMAARYNGAYGAVKVEIDQATFNPARVMGLVGTAKCKGVDTAERPHRLVTLDSPLEASPKPLDLAAWLSLHAPAEQPGAQAGNGQAHSGSQRAKRAGTVIDDYNARADWFRDVLPNGWTKHAELPGGEIQVRRPGKDVDKRATIGHAGRDVFHVFTNNAAPFQANETYSKFQVYALLHHGGDYAKGDFKAAVKDLAAQGFGTPRAGSRHGKSLFQQPSQDGAAQPAGSLDEQLASLPRTDLGNGERVVARFGADLRYCHPWKKWLRFDEHRWKADDTGVVHQYAKQTARRILKEAANISDKDECEQQVKWWRASENKSRIEAMLSCASSERGIPIIPMKWIGMDSCSTSRTARSTCALGRSVHTGEKTSSRGWLASITCPVPSARPGSVCSARYSQKTIS
jgi:hypothetical protein